MGDSVDQVICRGLDDRLVWPASSRSTERTGKGSSPLPGGVFAGCDSQPVPTSALAEAEARPFLWITHEVNASQQHIGDNRQFSRGGIRELTAVLERYHEALRTGGQNG